MKKNWKTVNVESALGENLGTVSYIPMPKIYSNSIIKKPRSLGATTTFFETMESLPKDLYQFYVKVVMQRISKSSYPLLGGTEYLSIKEKYPNAFEENGELKELSKIPYKIDNNI